MNKPFKKLKPIIGIFLSVIVWAVALYFYSLLNPIKDFSAIGILVWFIIAVIIICVLGLSTIYFFVIAEAIVEHFNLKKARPYIHTAVALLIIYCAYALISDSTKTNQHYNYYNNSNEEHNTPTKPDNKDVYRVGAICNDGWESSGTGKGACSHHGGVRCWKYSDGTCK